MWCCFSLPDGLSAPLDPLDRPDAAPLSRPPPPRPLPPEDVSRRRESRGALIAVVRDEQLAFYVSERMKNEVDRQAEAADLTRSEYLYRLVADALEREASDEFAQEIDAEARIQELIQIAADQMTQATEEMRDMNAKAGAYAAANFELLKTDHKDAVRRDALSTGSRRLRQDLDVVADDLGGDDQRPAQGRESTADDSDSPGDPFS